MSKPPDSIEFLVPPSIGEVKAHVRAEIVSRVLGKRLNRRVVFQVAETYEELERRMLAGEVDAAWAPPLLCARTAASARAVLRPVRTGVSQYFAALLCRAGAPFSATALQGARAAWVAQNSMAGYVLVREHLRASGIDPDAVFASQRFYGSYRLALLAVIEGEADVAPVHTTHPEPNAVRRAMAQHFGTEQPSLTPILYTGATPSDGIVVFDRLAAPEAEELVQALLELSASGEGPLLGLFQADALALDRAFSSVAESTASAGRPEGVTVLELDASAICRRVWSGGARFGREPAEIAGLPLAALFDAKDCPRLVSLLERAFAGETTGELQLAAGAAGRRSSVQVLKSPPALNGEPPTALLVVRDRTETDGVQEELFQLASLPLLSPSPVVELDRRGNIRYSNPSARRFFPSLLKLGAAHPLSAAVLAELGGRQESASVVMRDVEVDGRHYDLTVSHVPDALCFRLFAMDVSDRKRMQQALMQADRLAAMGTLAASVGHEINNPLAYVLANVTYALEKLPAANVDTEVLEVLGEAQKGAERIRGIVKSLKTLTRAETDEVGVVDLHALLEFCINVLGNELRHCAAVVRDFGAAPPVLGNEAKLGQVFLNLIQNAAQAMTGGDASRHQLTLATWADERGRAVVEVRDTGPGVPAEVRDRIFEPFFTTKPIGEGTGLGLWICHSIVQEHRGSLTLQPQEGAGSTFRVQLPGA